MGQSVNNEPWASDPGESVAVSVLVPVRNEERHIAASMAAMRAQRFPGSLEFLLVDGSSTDRTREILSELASKDPRIRVLENPRRTTPSGLNVALAHARGRWVARMDAHARYPEDYLALGVQRLARGDTRWVSGPQIPTGRGAISRAFSLALKTRLGRGGSQRWGDGRTAANGEFEVDSGVFDGVWERSTLLEFGGWDEGWPRNQDSEMAGRFLARGERLVCLPGMAARYSPRDSLISLFRQYFQYGEYREKTAVRHPHTMRRSHLLAPALALTAVATVASPSPFRRLARRAFAVYGAVLISAAAQAVSSEEEPEDVVLVPVVLAIMHFAHGAGALRGAVRYGPPLAALARVARMPGLAARLTPPQEPVFAPSLAGD
jgi:succinoglycan biosynthesis protein ExoA